MSSNHTLGKRRRATDTALSLSPPSNNYYSITPHASYRCKENNGSQRPRKRVAIRYLSSPTEDLGFKNLELMSKKKSITLATSSNDLYEPYMSCRHHPRKYERGASFSSDDIVSHRYAKISRLTSQLSEISNKNRVSSTAHCCKPKRRSSFLIAHSSLRHPSLPLFRHNKNHTSSVGIDNQNSAKDIQCPLSYSPESCQQAVTTPLSMYSSPDSILLETDHNTDTEIENDCHDNDKHLFATCAVLPANQPNHISLTSSLPKPNDMDLEMLSPFRSTSPSICDNSITTESIKHKNTSKNLLKFEKCASGLEESTKKSHNSKETNPLVMMGTVAAASEATSPPRLISSKSKSKKQSPKSLASAISLNRTSLLSRNHPNSHNKSAPIRCNRNQDSTHWISHKHTNPTARSTDSHSSSLSTSPSHLLKHSSRHPKKPISSKDVDDYAYYNFRNMRLALADMTVPPSTFSELRDPELVEIMLNEHEQFSEDEGNDDYNSSFYKTF